MNLHIGDAPGLVAFVREAVDAEARRVLRVEGADVVEARGRLFYRVPGEDAVGGPFGSLAALIRAVGDRDTRVRGPAEEWTWRGSRFRLDGKDVDVLEGHEPAGGVALSASTDDRGGCPFCHLAEDRLVATSDHGVAIHDAFPVAEGHALVLPRRHVASLFDLPEEARQELWRLAAEVRRLLARATGATDFNVGVNDGPAAGQTIPHAHIHVIPRRPGDVDDPRGGIRWVRPGRAVYWE
ncbi:MAG: HIT family protein [Gemmatimonadota bacterium]